MTSRPGRASSAVLPLLALLLFSFTPVMDLYRLFITKLRGYAVSRNKTLHVWEGFGPQGGQKGHKPMPASTVDIPTTGLSVTLFDGVFYDPLSLARDGFR